MFSDWDEHSYKCRCWECQKMRKAHEEFKKDMTWEKYGKSVPLEGVLSMKSLVRNMMKKDG